MEGGNGFSKWGDVTVCERCVSKLIRTCCVSMLVRPCPSATAVSSGWTTTSRVPPGELGGSRCGARRPERTIDNEPARLLDVEPFEVRRGACSPRKGGAGASNDGTLWRGCGTLFGDNSGKPEDGKLNVGTG